MGVMKTAERLTRRSYKRKIITLGVSLFSALAMFATGFASWIISSDATATDDGNVHVGVVENQSVTIEPGYQGGAYTDVNLIAFEPAAGDMLKGQNDTPYTAEELALGYGGRVFSDNGKFESMKIVLKAVITGVSNIGGDGLTIRFSALPAGVRAAATAGYIELPEAADGATININKDALNDSNPDNDNQSSGTLGEDNSWKLTKIEGRNDAFELEYHIVFGWGTVFGKDNPSLYYDIESKGGAVKGYIVEQTLNDFRKVLFNLSNDASPDKEDYDLGNFEIEIHAGLASES